MEAQRAEIEAIVREYLANNPEDVQRIVREYLLKNPEVLRDAMADMLAGRKPPPDRTAAIRSNVAAIFNSPHQVTLGNPDGDVTLVEFFDYNCGYCKQSVADKLDLMKYDPNLKVVLKEFPVLGSGSVGAAEVAIAVRMQDADGKRYLAFHQQLMGRRGRADRTAALTVAREVGCDMARLERDLASVEIKTTLDDSRRLAAVLGINGTPSYVIGEQVVAGAVGIAALNDRIKAARR